MEILGWYYILQFSPGYAKFSKEVDHGVKKRRRRNRKIKTKFPLRYTNKLSHK